MSSIEQVQLMKRNVTIRSEYVGVKYKVTDKHGQILYQLLRILLN